MRGREMKKCFKCGIEKPISEFYKHRRMKDGHLGKCKECTKKDSRDNRAANVDYYRAYDASRYQEDPKVKQRHVRYQQTPAGKDSMRKSREKWLSNNPVKRAAHVILGNSIKAGKIARPETCQDCGSGGRIHGHHHDYSKPLDVEWLCPRCHRKRHE